MITPPPLSKLRRDSTPPPLHDILPCAAVVEGQGAEGCQAVERWRREVGPRKVAVEGSFSRREAEEREQLTHDPSFSFLPHGFVFVVGDGRGRVGRLSV